MEFEEKVIELASGVKMSLEYTGSECTSDAVIITDICGKEIVLYIEEIAMMYAELELLGLV